jgi:biotin transport system substrate-specific component
MATAPSGNNGGALPCGCGWDIEPLVSPSAGCLMSYARLTLARSIHGIAFLPKARILKNALLVLGGSLALTLSAKVQVSIWPVPMTMQSMVVLLIGTTYGLRLGALTILAYLAEGVAGLPVFAGMAAGPAYLLGPTGGYLFGFLLGGVFSGWAGEHGWGRGLPRAMLVMIFGHVLIFGPGVLWLAALSGWSKAIMLGIAPFILATLLKSGLGAASICALRNLANNR